MISSIRSLKDLAISPYSLFAIILILVSWSPRRTFTRVSSIIFKGFVTINTKIRNLGFNASIKDIQVGQRFAIMYSVSEMGGFYEAFEVSYLG